MATNADQSTPQTTEEDKTPESSAKDSAAGPNPPEACPICYDSFTARCEVVPCGHAFDLECIQEWFSGNSNGAKSCPCCRTEMKELKRISKTTGDPEIISLFDKITTNRHRSQRSRSEHGAYYHHARYPFSFSRVHIPELEFADVDVPVRNAMEIPDERERQSQENGEEGANEEEYVFEEEALDLDELSRLVGVNLSDHEDEGNGFTLTDLVRTGVIDEAWLLSL